MEHNCLKYSCIILMMVNCMGLGVVHAQPSNDDRADATVIDECNFTYDGDNTGATNEITEAECAETSNIDCNTNTCDLTATAPDCDDEGKDVHYSVESDIWFKFCPNNTGDWTVDITDVSNCDDCSDGGSCEEYSGMQFTAFQGWIDSLHTALAGGDGGESGDIDQGDTKSYTFTINDVNDGCVWLHFDGYSGDECDISFEVDYQDGNCVLPIALDNFQATQTATGIKLSWEAVSETKDDYIEVQHAAKETPMRTVERASVRGEVGQNVKYSVTHENPTIGKNYYRLKTTSFASGVGYSKTIVVNYNARDVNHLSIDNIKQNGANSNLSVLSPITAKAFVKVYNINGQSVISKSVMLQEGHNSISLNTASLQSNAIYFSVIQVKDKRAKKKFVKSGR